MSGSTMSMIGGALAIFGALFSVWGAYKSSLQKAETDKALLTGNTELQAKADSTKVALDDTKDALIAKGDELTGVQKLLADAQKELIKKSDENAALNKKFSAYAMGEGSFIYLHVRGFGGALPEARLVHVGENPVRDTEILVHNVTDQVPALELRLTGRYDTESAPTRRVFLDAVYPVRPSKLTVQVFETNPSGQMYAYFIYVSGANGTYRQILQLMKVGEEWKQAYKVQAVIGKGKLRPVGEFFDEGFPAVALLQRSAEFPDLPAPE